MTTNPFAPQTWTARAAAAPAPDPDTASGQKRKHESEEDENSAPGDQSAAAAERDPAAKITKLESPALEPTASAGGGARSKLAAFAFAGKE